MSGWFAVGYYQYLPGAALLLRQQIAGQHQGMVQIGAGHPGVPVDFGQVLFLYFAGIVGETDNMKGVPGVLSANEGKQSQRDFLGGLEVVEQAHRPALVQQHDCRRPGHVLVAINLKVLGANFHRHPRTTPPNCILDRSLQVQLEWVTELVRFGLTQQVATGPSSVQLVVAHPVFLQVNKNFPQGFLSDPANAPRR